MKLATVLHSLGLTGSVLHFSKTINPPDTYTEKETQRKVSSSGQYWPRWCQESWNTGTVTNYTPLDVSFLSYVTVPLQAGLVIACPSTKSPDLYSWTRNLAPRLQASQRGLRFGRRSIIARTNRRIHLRRSNHSANSKSEWPCGQERARRAQVQHRWLRIHQPLGPSATRCVGTPWSGSGLRTEEQM